MASVGADFLIFALASLSATILGLIIVWKASHNTATHQIFDILEHPHSAMSFLRRLSHDSREFLKFIAAGTSRAKGYEGQTKQRD